MLFQEFLHQELSENEESFQWIEENNLFDALDVVDDEDELEELLDDYECPDFIISRLLTLWDEYLDSQDFN